MIRFCTKHQNVTSSTVPCINRSLYYQLTSFLSPPGCCLGKYWYQGFSPPGHQSPWALQSWTNLSWWRRTLCHEALCPQQGARPSVGTHCSIASHKPALEREYHWGVRYGDGIIGGVQLKPKISAHLHQHWKKSLGCFTFCCPFPSLNTVKYQENKDTHTGRIPWWQLLPSCTQCHSDCLGWSLTSRSWGSCTQWPWWEESQLPGRWGSPPWEKRECG